MVRWNCNWELLSDFFAATLLCLPWILVVHETFFLFHLQSIERWQRQLVHLENDRPFLSSPCLKHIRYYYTYGGGIAPAFLLVQDSRINQNLQYLQSLPFQLSSFVPSNFFFFRYIFQNFRSHVCIFWISAIIIVKNMNEKSHLGLAYQSHFIGKMSHNDGKIVFIQGKDVSKIVFQWRSFNLLSFLIIRPKHV